MLENIVNEVSVFLKRFWTHIFVIATGFAALSHSTWTLATAFGGKEPQQFSGAWWSWLIPGLLIAFSFDIGQIAISVELRNGERTRAKYIAFLVLAISTYFLQWWYLVHHLPSLVLAEGLRPDWKPFAEFVSDAIIWVAPGLLPVATTLYTWSYAKPPKQRIAPNPLRTAPPIRSSEKPAKVSEFAANVEQIQLANPGVHSLPPGEQMTAMYIAKCPDCGWEKPCETERSKINSLNAHSARCPMKVQKGS